MRVAQKIVSREMDSGSFWQDLNGVHHRDQPVLHLVGIPVEPFERREVVQAVQVVIGWMVAGGKGQRPVMLIFRHRPKPIPPFVP